MVLGFLSANSLIKTSRRRSVIILRYGLLLSALLLIGGVMGWPLLQPSGPSLPLGQSRPQHAGKTPSAHNTLEKPRYQSVDSRDQPYVVTAHSATQSDPTLPLYHLKNPYAYMTLRDESHLSVASEQGTYHEAEQRLDLSDNVTLSYDGLYILKTPALTVDMKQNTIEGTQPVVGTGPAVTIRAEGLRVLDRGQTVLFAGKSHLVLIPSNASTPPEMAAFSGK